MATQDKTVTILGATARVHSVQFTRETVAGPITATAYGSASRSDGTRDNEAVTWILSGAAETTVRNFMDNQATMRLREKMGLESP